MAYKFIQCHSSNYRSGRTSKIKYIVIHYTSNNGDTAQNNLRYFANTANIKASAHYFCDEHEIAQSVKDKDTAYHCGTSGKYYHPHCRNSNSIGIEMCSRKDKAGKYYIKQETIDHAVELTCELMDKYNIPAENVIRHYDVTHKLCPEPFVRDSAAWDAFKGRLDTMTQEQFNKMANAWLASLGAQETPDFAKDAVQYFIDKGTLKGDANGRPMACKPITRGEYCVLRKREIDAGL